MPRKPCAKQWNTPGAICQSRRRTFIIRAN